MLTPHPEGCGDGSSSRWRRPGSAGQCLLDQVPELIHPKWFADQPDAGLAEQRRRGVGLLMTREYSSAAGVNIDKSGKRE